MGGTITKRGRMAKRAVNLEGVVDRLRLRVLAFELGRLPAFLPPAVPAGGRADGDGVPTGPRRRRPEQVPGPLSPRPRHYVAGGRIAAMVDLISR